MRAIPSLTGLRGIAAVWVLLSHLGNVGPLIGAGWIARIGILPMGWVGVDLFFVLSGFVLMWTHGADFTHPTPEAARRFAASRILRVYPLSTVVLVMIAALFFADPGYADWYRSQAPANLSVESFIRTALLATRWVVGDGGEWNQPVWSLSVELVGYAAFPLLAWLLMARAKLTSIAIGIGCFGLLAAYDFWNDVQGNTFDQMSALVRMGCSFTAGMAACRVRQIIGDRPLPHAAAVTLAAALFVAIACRVGRGFVFIPPGFAVLVFFLSFGVGNLGRFLSSRPILFLGKISFPLYLVHVTPLYWLGWHVYQAGLGPVAASFVLLAGAAGAGVVATILHYAVECPTHRWARRSLQTTGAFRVTGMAIGRRLQAESPKPALREPSTSRF